MTRKSPDQVFTPRAPRVNENMYVTRRALEERLLDVVSSSKYIIIHGESGNGKTWLYKRVLARACIHYDVVNLGQIANADSLEGVFRHKLGELGYKNRASQDSNTVAGIRPWNVGVEQQTKISEIYSVQSAFVSLLDQVRFRANGESRAVLVLDNFESIIDNQAFLSQLSAIILTADDEAISEKNIQVIIVGVPGNLKEAISKLPNAGPVSNRLTELPEVARMTDAEARDLIKRGFKDELQLSIEDDLKNDLYTEICWSTDRIAQHIHELCLVIAQKAFRNNYIISRDVVTDALTTWIGDSLSADLAVIEAAMNARDTKVGRKNQALFAIGACKTEDFKPSDVEILVRDHFKVGGAALNISQILAGFASQRNPIIRRTPKQDAWRFVSPKLKMAIRARLYKTDDGRVAVRK